MKQQVEEEVGTEARGWRRDVEPSRKPVERAVGANRGQSRFVRLVEACKRKDLQQIRAILEQAPELLHRHDRNRRSFLHYLAIILDDCNEATASTADKLGQQTKCLGCFEYLKEFTRSRLGDTTGVLPWWCQSDRDGLTVLHFAVISSNVALVRYLLFELDAIDEGSSGGENHARGALENGRISEWLIRSLDGERHSALHWAVITNNEECVKLLVSHSGVDQVHLDDQNGATPLHYATQTNDYPKYRAQLRQMLQNAARSSSTASLDRAQANGRRREVSFDGGHEASGTLGREYKNAAKCSGESSVQVLSYFLRLEGINLECVDRDRRTPLLWAASSGNWEAILLLAQAGANLLARDANSLGAPHCLASHGFTECLESLLKLHRERQRQRQRANSGSLADATNESVVNQADHLNCTPLFYAVLSANIDCMELLLDQGAQFDWQDVKGRTAAHFAALRGQLNSLRLLEARGANLWVANKQGDLPLHYAIKSGRHQVISWLLERSPYERAVNAISNTGRAPIHLAVIKNNAALLEWLVEKYGANVNQLVKVRDKSVSTNNGEQCDVTTPTGSSQYKYETALDMARGMGHRACSQLLERYGAQSAREVLSSRGERQAIASSSPFCAATSNKSNAALAATRSSSTSVEPQLSELPAVIGTNLNGILAKVPSRPAPLSSQIPQSSDSSAPSVSSSLSHSSTMSIRGATDRRLPEIRPLPARQHSRESARISRPDELHFAPRGAQSMSGCRQPYKGGISYHNDRINASIKCKIYKGDKSCPCDSCPHDQTNNFHQHSFPPLKRSPDERSTRQATSRFSHSTGSLDRLAGSASTPGQEIITNVNVYTSPCASHHPAICPHLSESLECKKCLPKRPGSLAVARRQFNVSASESDSEGSSLSGISTSLMGRAQEDVAESGSLDREPRGENLEASVVGARQHPASNRVPAAHQQQTHFATASNHDNYAHQLSVIFSAEEERSTSGETLDGARAPGSLEAGPRPLGAAIHDEEPRFDRSQRGSRIARSRHRSSQVRSPVAEYIHSQTTEQHKKRSSSHEASERHQQQASRVDYSTVKPRVDSHRNDSGLSSAFGFVGGELDSPTSRRYSFYQQHQAQQAMAANRSPMYARAGGAAGPNRADHARSCSRQTIIKTRRLSVDSVELAARVEKSIRKYKQETKLFEELQCLKRSQIRSGRANEGLLVKRLVDRLKKDTLDLPYGLDNYTGPYTYKAYELFLYDQLRKLSQSNRAKLDGNILAHEFHHPTQSYSDYEDGDDEGAGLDSTARGAKKELARNFSEEDLRAEMELKNVINRGASEEVRPDGAPADIVAIVPSGALEEIRVKTHESSDISDAGTSTSETVKTTIGQENVHQSSVETQDEQTQGAMDATQAASASLDSSALEEQSRSRITKGCSSANSSRRSSIDIEREKLEQLPLMLASSSPVQPEWVEPAQIEDEAKSLSAAIITDALGNVSRVGSPDSKLKMEQHEENETPGPGVDEDSERQATSDSLSDSSPPVTSAGRRRSVVNIGNKLEVIYHDVGIEIDRVVEEQNDASLSDAEPEAHQDRSERIEEESGNVEASTEVPDTTEAEYNERVSKGEDGKKSLDDIKAQTEEEKEQSAKRETNAPVAFRRASSPNAPTAKHQIVRQHQSRRSIAAPSTSKLDTSMTTDSNASNDQKVFNGYDLDKWHLKRGSSTTIGASGERSRASDSKIKLHGRISPTYKRNLQRSRPPKRPLKIMIPLNEIRARWNEIKRAERQKRVNGSRSNARSLDEEAMDGRLHSTVAKSQPNLHEPQDALDYIEIIYEINKRSSDWCNRDLDAHKTKRDSHSSGQWWCQKKIIKVIDVRSLKRTLSLPESIMYSNELLKKFNVLRL